MNRKNRVVEWKKWEKNNQDVSVPDIAAKEFNEGYDLETSLAASFESRFCKLKAIFTFSLLCASLAVHPGGCRYRLSWWRRNNAFWCGCPYHGGGNHLAPGYLPFRRKCGCCNYSYIHRFREGPAGKAGCPSPALCRRNGRKKRTNIFLYKKKKKSLKCEKKYSGK